MLVLTRRAGEEIVIGDIIRVTVIAVRGNQVRLGITAPADISICRQELYPWPEKNGQAARSAPFEPNEAPTPS
jgi:carbon storage regulator